LELPLVTDHPENGALSEGLSPSRGQNFWQRSDAKQVIIKMLDMP
jgi:hypothetical protein